MATIKDYYVRRIFKEIDEAIENSISSKPKKFSESIFKKRYEKIKDRFLRWIEKNIGYLVFRSLIWNQNRWKKVRKRNKRGTEDL